VCVEGGRLGLDLYLGVLGTEVVHHLLDGGVACVRAVPGDRDRTLGGQVLARGGRVTWTAAGDQGHRTGAGQGDGEASSSSGGSFAIVRHGDSFTVRGGDGGRSGRPDRPTREDRPPWWSGR